MKSKVLQIMLLLTIGQTVAQGPGAMVRVTKNGVDYANQVAKAAIAKLLSEFRLNDMEGKGSGISYWLKNFRFQNVAVPDSNIILNPGERGLTWTVTNFGMDLSVDYRAKKKILFVPLSNSGSVSANFRQVSLTITVGVDQNDDTSPKLTTRSCRADIGHFNMRFHGSLAWLINLFKGLFEGKIKDTLRNNICDLVTRQINTKAADSLRRMRLEADIAEKFVIDYRLLAPVLFTDSYLESQHKGAVYWKANRQNPIPFSPDVIPEWNDNSNMLYVWVTEYTARTLTYAAHTFGYLQYMISSDKLPEQYKDYLSTTCPDSVCAGNVISQLGEKYPNSLVTIRIASRAAPDVDISSNGLSLTLFCTLDLSTTSAASVVLANVTISLTGSANVRADRIAGNITRFSTVVESYQSQVGDIDKSAINSALEEGLNLIVIPQMNAIASAGVPLPIIPDIALKNSRIIYQENVVIIGTDAQYQGIV